MSGRLAGRVALITGASRGIGAAVAVRYAEEGAHVILVARTQGGLEEVDDRVREAGGEATLAPFDLTDGEAIDRLGAAVAERWKRLDGEEDRRRGPQKGYAGIPGLHCRPDEAARLGRRSRRSGHRQTASW